VPGSIRIDGYHDRRIELRRRIAVLAISVLIAVAGCGDQGGDNVTTAPDDGPDPTVAEPASSISTSETDLGTILVDGSGFTLYVFTQDTDGESVCYNDCAALWPPVAADTPVSSDLDASIFGSTTRTDGSEQLTVNDRPLYLYTPDTSPGDVTGQGFGGVWFVVDAAGEMIAGLEESAATGGAGEDDPADDYGY
jgi:predicted lipoprotein with Yx(FWY)xxD motif